MKIYVRWLGAFRPTKGHTLSESLKFEFLRKDEAACEIIHKTKRGYVSHVHAHVGIMLKPESIFREFKHDCWSEYDETGRLYTDTPNRGSDHSEAWAHMSAAITAVVVDMPLKEMRRDTRMQLEKFLKLHPELDFYKINGYGDLIKIKGE